MQVIIHQWAFEGNFEQLALLPLQEFVSDWYGDDVNPSAGFAFATDGDYLWFLSRHNVPAQSHPNACLGSFQPELWKYDLAEWFMATPDASAYWEFNLSPNGAWWACAFEGVRQPACPGATAAPLQGVETRSIETDEGWVSMAKIPLCELAAFKDIDLRHCKLAVAFILNSPNSIFMTSALDLTGEPDYHRPLDFTAPHVGSM